MQRISGLSFRSLVVNALGLQRQTGTQGETNTLIDAFDYPRRGPGTMWDRMATLIKSGTIALNAPADRIEWRYSGITAVHAAGRRYGAEHFISSMPVLDFFECLSPAPPESLYRDTTCLGLECFCFEGDELRTATDEVLIALEPKGLAAPRLAEAELTTDGALVRMPRAYPIYNDTYQYGLALVRRFFEWCRTRRSSGAMACANTITRTIQC